MTDAADTAIVNKRRPVRIAVITPAGPETLPTISWPVSRVTPILHGPSSSWRTSHLRALRVNSSWAGTRQDRCVSRLERGSRASALVVKSDRVRYYAAREFRFFRDAHLVGASRRLSQAPERMS
jgi:hypothetical protein